ncbi:MAG: coproporphyrinogen III oxidase [Actinobacteria bacterium]|nr:coproporphyrinogen III oxidase [Actinomycetota bacterium]
MARALYIHWPFCIAKCPYCDFNSHVRKTADIAQWKAALVADMQHEHDETQSQEPLASIFFGGGTPSLMPPTLVAALLEKVERLWGFDPTIEITLEANPSSVEAGNFAELAAAGINRVSLGVQSLSDEVLRFLGRLHGVDEALKAVTVAQRHFARVSIDLIYARPDQTEADWQVELGEALALGTDHMSLYQLTIEPATRFATDVRRGVFEPLGDDYAADLFALTREMTEAAGLPAYEVSNHARPGQESRHNLTYWRYQDYVGIGPGAHGRRCGIATIRHRKPENYLSAVATQGHGIAEARPLAHGEQASEALLMGLRLAEGVDLAALARRFDAAPAALVDEAKLALYRDLGLVWMEQERIGVTPQGMPLLDALLGEVVCTDLVTS